MTAVRDHLERDVIGWWDREGADDARGGVHTCFSNGGELLSTEKYTWSQGRWAWTAALIADEIDAGRVSGEAVGEATSWRTRSRRTAGFLHDHAFTSDGRTSFRLTTDGRRLPGTEDEASVFADLFAVLGLAGAARGTREERWLDTAHRTLRVAAASIADRSAATAPYPVPTGFRDLAGPMSLLHTAAELHRTSASDESLRVVTDARDTLLQQFVGGGTWWEFRPDRAGDHDTLLARHVTPGHLLELLWMLVHAADLLPQLTIDDADLTALALRALEVGWDETEGGVLRYVDRDTGGKPRGRRLGTPYEDLVLRTWDTKLWWVHAETLYATSLLARRTGSAELHRWARRVSDYTFATFPDPQGREWIQIRARDGSPSAEVVALPVKDPLHVTRSLLFLNALETPALETPTSEPLHANETTENPAP